MKFAINYLTKNTNTTYYVNTLENNELDINGLVLEISIEDDKGMIIINDDRPPLSCRCPFKWICKKVAGLFGYKSCCQAKPACCKGK